MAKATPAPEVGRRGWCLAGVLLLPLVASGCGRGPAAPRPRNLILISVDTLRPDFLSVYGHERETSPTLDALARSGVRFTDVTAAAPWTLPSHASMLTGLYPAHHGVKDHETRLPESIETIAEDFQKAGFETLAVVNTHNLGHLQFQMNQGFGRFEYVEETVRDPRGRIRCPNRGPEILEKARGLLESRPSGKPFFLFLHFYDVHTDFTARPEIKERFVEPYSGKIKGHSQQLNGIRNRGEQLNEDDLRFLRQMYEAEIWQFDALLGEFFAWLREQGLADDTLFAITSDHGEEFQEHGGLLHGRTYYQEVMHVPLILAGPGLPAGVVVDTPVDGVDVTPTLLAVMGVPSSAHHDGIDLSPSWSGGVLPVRTLFAEADHNVPVEGNSENDVLKMVRRGDEKLVLNTRSNGIELFDLAHDPHEHEDLSGSSPERIASLQAELDRYLASARPSEATAAPTEAEQSMLDALGYGGGDEDEDEGK